MEETEKALNVVDLAAAVNGQYPEADKRAKDLVERVQRSLFDLPSLAAFNHNYRHDCVRAALFVSHDSAQGLNGNGPFKSHSLKQRY